MPLNSDQVARKTRNIESNLDALIGFLKLCAEKDPLWDGKVAVASAIRDEVRDITDAADEGILPGPWPYPGPKSEPVHQYKPPSLYVPDGAHAATDIGDDGGWQAAPMDSDGATYTAAMARAWVPLEGGDE